MCYGAQITEVALLQQIATRAINWSLLQEDKSLEIRKYCYSGTGYGCGYREHCAQLGSHYLRNNMLGLEKVQKPFTNSFLG